MEKKLEVLGEFNGFTVSFEDYVKENEPDVTKAKGLGLANIIFVNNFQVDVYFNDPSSCYLLSFSRAYNIWLQRTITSQKIPETLFLQGTIVCQSQEKVSIRYIKIGHYLDGDTKLSIEKPE